MKNELENQAYELCLAIEELPAGEYQTKLSIMASDLSQNIRAAKSQLSMKAIIEKEIKWCEENRGMKGEVYEEAFIAGLKQVLFFINAAQHSVQPIIESVRELPAEVVEVESVLPASSG